MNMSRSLAVIVSVCGGVCSSLGAVPTAKTQELLDSNSDLRAMFSGERLVALYGVAFATDSDPRTTTDEFVQAFLAAESDALGVDGVKLTLEDKITIRNGKFSVYTYTQTIEGLPVHASVVKIPVLLGSTEKIAYAGMRLVQLPEEALPEDVLLAPDALAAVQESAAYGYLTDFTTPEKVIYEAYDETLHRAWRFYGYDTDESYVFFVDTGSGDIVGVENRVFYEEQCAAYAVTGTVSGYGTPCCAADSGTNEPVEMNLEGATVSVFDGTYPACPPDGGTILAERFTDENGQYLLSGFDPPVTVASRLVGEWVTVVDCAGDVGCDVPALGEDAQAVECEDLTGQCLPTSPVDFLFNSSPEEYATAMVNAFYVVEKTHDWFKDLQPTSTAIDENLLVGVNSGAWSAQYVEPLPYLRFRDAYFFSQSYYNNDAFSTIISHEYGHFVHFRLLSFPGRDPRFTEGIADTVGTLVWDTSELGLNLGEGQGAVRDVDPDPDEFEFDPRCGCEAPCTSCTENNYPCGDAIAGAFWDLREEITPGGVQTTNELFADFMFITDGAYDESIIVEVLVVDDDDGDLTNGTPHSVEILASFAGLHGWSNPDPQGDGVEVRWEGPAGSPDPETDYSVYYEVVPPNVVLKTTVGSGGVPVEKWIIGRTPDQQGGERDLGTIYADWDTPAHNILVEVGTFANEPCGNLNVIDISAQAANKWSNIRLALTGSVIRAQCYPSDTGAGGRVSGTVAGDAARVIAEAIGSGASGPGTLTVNGELHRLNVDEIPDDPQSDPELFADWIGHQVQIASELEGNIEANVVERSGSIYSCPPLGEIHVQGTGVSTGDITVTTLLGAGILIDGPYEGILDITNMSENGGRLPEIRVVRLSGQNGQVVVTNDLIGLLTVTGTGLSSGDILVNGDIDAVVLINGSMSGDIHADADDQDGGDLTDEAIITVSGVFTGDLCAANLRPGEIPQGPALNISWGEGGTICRQEPSP
jgi:hypothetical protein